MSLGLSTLKSWLWEAACVIRGPVDAPKFKNYILPLIFLKRLSDVFDDETNRLAADFSSEAKAFKLMEQDHKLVRFFIPKKARWAEIARKTTGLGEYLTDAVRAVARENPRLSGVTDATDFNATTSGSNCGRTHVSAPMVLAYLPALAFSQRTPRHVHLIRAFLHIATQCIFSSAASIQQMSI